MFKTNTKSHKHPSIRFFSKSKTQLINQRKQKSGIQPRNRALPYRTWWGAASPILNDSPVVYTTYNRTRIRNVHTYIYIYILTQSFWTGTKVIRRNTSSNPQVSTLVPRPDVNVGWAYAWDAACMSALNGPCQQKSTMRVATFRIHLIWWCAGFFTGKSAGVSCRVLMQSFMVMMVMISEQYMCVNFAPHQYHKYVVCDTTYMQWAFTIQSVNFVFASYWLAFVRTIRRNLMTCVPLSFIDNSPVGRSPVWILWWYCE